LRVGMTTDIFMLDTRFWMLDAAGPILKC